jgi:hypothetical protein
VRLVITIGLLLWSASAHADTITTNTFEGCLYIEDLLKAGVGPTLTWTIHNEVAGHRYQTGLWMGDVQGCKPTTHHQRGLFITGGTDNLRSVEAGEIIDIRFDWRRHVTQDPCGRVWQWDAENDTTNEFHALLLTYRDTKSPCQATLQKKPPVVVRPPVPVPLVPPQPPPPFAVLPKQVEETVPVPEPGTLVLLLAGGALATRWKKGEGMKADRPSGSAG